MLYNFILKDEQEEQAAETTSQCSTRVTCTWCFWYLDIVSFYMVYEFQIYLSPQFAGQRNQQTTIFYTGKGNSKLFHFATEIWSTKLHKTSVIHCFKASTDINTGKALKVQDHFIQRTPYLIANTYSHKPIEFTGKWEKTISEEGHCKDGTTN